MHASRLDMEVSSDQDWGDSKTLFCEGYAAKSLSLLFPFGRSKAGMQENSS